MKPIFALVLCFCFVASLPAETVMINLQNDEGVGFIIEERVEYAYAVEEGAMEPFFDSDHIVFNMGFNFEENSEPPSVEIAKRVALSGGAALLLNLVLGEADPDTLTPVHIRYSLLDLTGHRVIAEGLVTSADVRGGDTKSSIAICFLMGKHAATESIRIWAEEVF